MVREDKAHWYKTIAHDEAKQKMLVAVLVAILAGVALHKLGPEIVNWWKGANVDGDGSASDESTPLPPPATTQHISWMPDGTVESHLDARTAGRAREPKSKKNRTPRYTPY